MIRRAKQFTVCVPNKPGTGAKLLSRLGKINLIAVSVVDSIDCSTIRLVPGSAAKMAQILSKARICSTTQPVLVVDLPNLPGALLKICRKLARARVNIEYFYGSAGSKAADAPVVFRVGSLAKAIKALK